MKCSSCIIFSSAKSTKTKEATSSSSSTSTSTSSSNVVPGTRQTTLFGLAPGVSNPSESKRGRKKKVTEAVDDEEASESATGSKAKSGGLGAFLSSKSSKELPREGEEFEETQMTDIGDVESQVTNESESQNLEETQGETQTEESQMEETQEVSFFEHSTEFLAEILIICRRHKLKKKQLNLYLKVEMVFRNWLRSVWLRVFQRF